MYTINKKEFLDNLRNEDYFRKIVLEVDMMYNSEPIYDIYKEYMLTDGKLLVKEVEDIMNTIMLYNIMSIYKLDKIDEDILNNKFISGKVVAIDCTDKDNTIDGEILVISDNECFLRTTLFGMKVTLLINGKAEEELVNKLSIIPSLFESTTFYDMFLGFTYYSMVSEDDTITIKRDAIVLTVIKELSDKCKNNQLPGVM